MHGAWGADEIPVVPVNSRRRLIRFSSLHFLRNPIAFLFRSVPNFSLIQGFMTSVDSWRDVLSKVFWLRHDPLKRWVANWQKSPFRRARHLSAAARSTPIAPERMVGSNRSQKMFDRGVKELSNGVFGHWIRLKIGMIIYGDFEQNLHFWLKDVPSEEKCNEGNWGGHRCVSALNLITQLGIQQEKKRKKSSKAADTFWVGCVSWADRLGGPHLQRRP